MRQVSFKAFIARDFFQPLGDRLLSMPRGGMTLEDILFISGLKRKHGLNRPMRLLRYERHFTDR